MHEARNGCTDELRDLGVLFLNHDRKLEMQSGLHSRSLIFRLLRWSEKLCCRDDLNDRPHLFTSIHEVANSFETAIEESADFSLNTKIRSFGKNWEGGREGKGQPRLPWWSRPVGRSRARLLREHGARDLVAPLRRAADDRGHVDRPQLVSPAGNCMYMYTAVPEVHAACRFASLQNRKENVGLFTHQFTA